VTIIQGFWLLMAMVWLYMELLIAKRSRQSGGRNNTERHSEYAIWLVILLGVFVALYFKQKHLAPLPLEREIRLIFGAIIFVFGLGVRVYAIKYLGRFFSSRVEIQQAHKLITSGPYRYVRHPSYTGLLIGFTGAGVAMGDLLSLLFVLIPSSWVFIKRIKLEEALLLQHFGDEFEMYKKQSKKLIPGFF
jgi:protein-S-isoprenylcysteine O-methyltransferase Ste14